MRIPSLLVCALCLYSATLNAAELARHQETASGAQGWRVQDQHTRIELNPLYRDQVRAFYIGRGFSEAVAEQISKQCVFQTVIQNVSSADEQVLVDVNLADWRISSSGESASRSLVAKQEWMDTLEKAGASQAALLAFKWATFPEQQDFKLSGDYGWGMILFGEQAGDGFDLQLQWRVNGAVSEYTIPNLFCLGDAPGS